MLLPSLVESKPPHQLLVSLWAVTSLQPSGGGPGAYAPVETGMKAAATRHVYDLPRGSPLTA